MAMSPPSSPFPPARALALAACANLGGLLAGINLSLLSGLLESPNFAAALSPVPVTPFLKSSLSTELLIVFTLTSPAAGHFVARYGRRPGLLAVALLYFLSSVLPLLATPSVALLAIARALAGAGDAVATVACTAYAAEIAPPELRGALVNLFQLAITAGILYSQLTNLAYANTAWRAPVLLAAVPAAVMGLLVALFVPESPAWLANGRDNSAQEARDGDAPSLFDLLRDASARRRLCIGAGVCAGQQMCGSMAVVLYAPALVSEALGWASGSQGSLAVAVAVGTVLMLATVLVVLVTDRVGRRPLLLGGGLVMAGALLVLAVVHTGVIGRGVVLTVSALLVYILGFALSYGALPFVVAAEVFPVRYRAVGLSFCSIVLGVTAVFVGLTFLPMLNWIGGGVYVFYAAWMFALSWFVWKHVPETKNMTLDEIDALLQ